MFTGWATATEAAAFGVLGALIIAWWSGALSARDLLGQPDRRDAALLHDLFILAGARLPQLLHGVHRHPARARRVGGFARVGPYALLAVLALVYLVLGCLIDGISMIVLTMSIVLPMVEAARIDLIWFGIFIVILVEIAQITPPVGFNLFVLQTMTGRDINYVARASLPFFFMMLVCIALIIVAFPELATWLPDALIGVAKK